MQPQGLAALMPQGQPAPQMNNPRLAAAMDVVTSDAEENILDPRTLAMLKYKDAIQAMQAADQMMAAAQPQPMPPTVAERTRLAAEQGIAGLAARLSPGVQQRGAQIAAQQGAGGLPQLAAPNMARMMGGGIVGYAPGGAVKPAPTPTPIVQRPVPMGQPNVESQAGMRDDVARYIYLYENLRTGAEAATDPEQKAVITQRMRELQQTFDPETVAEAHMQMSRQSGLAGGGIVAFQPGGAVQEPAVDPEDAAYRELLRKGEQQALESGIASIGRDREAEARAAGARLQELAGVSDLVEQRKAEQASLRALQEAQFSPEEERRRLLRAALAGGAERGLGGFGMGYAAEEGRIAGERQAVQQQSIADLDKLIADLRAMGLSQFQAEQAAAQMVETGRNTGMSTVQSLANARRQADDAAAGREIQREQMQTQRDVAEIQAGSSQFAQAMRIMTQTAMRANPSLTAEEAEAQALNRLQLLDVAGRPRGDGSLTRQQALDLAIQLASSDVTAWMQMPVNEKKDYVEALAATLQGGTPTPAPTMNQQAGGSAPTLEQFMSAARQANPGVSDEALTAYYNQTYGQ